VSNFKLEQIGDWVWVYMEEPFQSVKKVNDYNIIIGLSTPNTTGKVSIKKNSTKVTGYNTKFSKLGLKTGDNIIIGDNRLPVKSVDSDNKITLKNKSSITLNQSNLYLDLNSNNTLDTQFKWSQARALRGSNYSQAMPIKDITTLEFNPELPLWFKLKFEVDKLGKGNSLTILSINYDLEQTNGSVINCPQFSADCDDPWASNGSANIIADCENDNLFQPYELEKPAAMYQQLATVATEMYGHQVEYFRVEPDERSRDVVLHEYSLYNVIERDYIKIMVPNNEFPSREFDYDLFGMGFDEFEIHVTFDQFNRVFGRGTNPRPRDYIYIPQLNRMYEVFSVNYADEFNLEVTYWKLMLRKYEERTSNQHQTQDTQEAMEDLVTGEEEVFGAETQDEYDQTTKPKQYQTIDARDNDGIRESFAQSLDIKDEEIRNTWTVIAKNYYDIANVDKQAQTALVYSYNSVLNKGNNLAFTSWIRPQKGLGQNGFESFFNGMNDTGSLGLNIQLTRDVVKVKVNSEEVIFNLNSKLELDRWYGVVLNLISDNKNLELDIFEIDPQANSNKPHKKSNTIYSIFDRTGSLGQKEISWNLNDKWRLETCNLHATNIRLFTKPITNQKINILQQYVVRDEQNVIIVDNARPSLNLRKYY
jgi:hypothetical protein